MQSKKQQFLLFLKGMAMGAADVVPGVSGGTVAFITGIYEELINTINGVNLQNLRLLKSDGFSAFWKAINGRFLLVLLSGIALSVLTLASQITHLLETQPILVWSFFFGLVLASIVVIFKDVNGWRWFDIVIALATASFAYYTTTLEPLVNGDASSLYLFIAGAIAICAMILPGISGSFILVLLGAYEPVLAAIKNRDIQTLGVVVLGAITGILTFSRILKWLFANYKNSTLLALIGFILGSLNKLWPWKEVVSWRMNSKGLEVPLIEKSVLPSQFDGDPQLTAAIIFAIVGLLLILGIERLAKYSE